MIIKVCGIKETAQMLALNALYVDYVGINFYRPSPRFYNGEPLNKIATGRIKKVGIVVDLSLDEIKNLIELHQLDAIQLHGHELPELVEQVAQITEVIKAFPHTAILDNELLKQYNCAKYFLFDTVTKNHGGSGIQFDWQVLENYTYDKMFLLAGGINGDDFEKINALKGIKKFVGVDINSKFETEPGIKDLNKIVTFIKAIRI